MKNLETSGVATGSTAKAVSSRSIRSIPREPVVRIPKMALAAEYNIAGQKDRLLSVNVHAINFTTNSNFQTHIQQVMELVADHQGPVVLAGDFNTWSQTRIRILEKAVADAGLTEVKFDHDPRKNPLDHVFVRGLNVLRGSVLTGVPSDHPALSVELSTDTGH